MAGHSALVGDDSGGPAHGGDHVGHGHLGDEDVPVLDDVEAHPYLVDDDLSHGESGAGSQSGGDDVRAGGGGLNGLVGGGVPGDGDGPRLYDVYLVVLDAPLHVHGLVVVDLDLASDLCDLADALVGDLLGLDHVLGHVLLDDSSLGAADVLPGLGRDDLLLDVPLGLVDDVGVGGDLSSDDRLSEPVSGLDDDLVGSVVGVLREHDSGELGVDHPLDDDGELDLAVRVPLLLAVCDGPRGEQGGPAFPDLVEEVRLVLHVEVGLLLSGEAGVGKVLGGGAGPHCDESGLSLGEQRLVFGDDLVPQVDGDLVLLEKAPDLVGSCGEAVVGVSVYFGDLLVDRIENLAGIDKIVISDRSEDECLRNGESGVCQLSEVGSFASHEGHIFNV